MRYTIWYTVVIKITALVAYAMILLEIVALSREVRIRDVVASTDNSMIDAEIDICYPLHLFKHYCHPLTDSDQRNETVNFDQCDFEGHMPINCCTKDLKKPGEIIKKFKEKIQNLVRISSESTEDPPKQEYQVRVQFDQICVKIQFTNLAQSVENRRSVSFKIQSDENNYQTFVIHLSFVKKQQNGERYVAARKNLIRRKCWATSTRKGCLETGKDVTIEIEHFSVRYLKKPFQSRCNPEDETPAECYEKCVKKEKPHFLMSYNESDNIDLDFGAYDYKKCSRACSRPNCFTEAFYIHGIDERENVAYLASNYSNETQNFPGLIILKALSSPYGIDAIPVLSHPRFVWMIMTSVATFMGLDCYGIFVRTTKLYGKTGNLVKNPRRSQVKVFFAFFIFSVCFTLAFFCEKILFDFGADPGPFKESYRTEIESLKERDVSISVCFDLCNVWVRGPCNETILSGMTLRDLENKTHSQSWFRERASLKNNVKYAPIRQKDKIIPTFYREMKKCWLVSHEAPNVLPHLPIQRKSFIHLTLQTGLKQPWTTPRTNEPKKTQNYTHFYVVDGNGLAFPDIDAHPIRKSVLHSVEIHYEREPCKKFARGDETNTISFLVTREDQVQQCIVEEFVNEHGALPMFVNLKVCKVNETHDNEVQTYEQYLKKPFKKVDRNTEVELIKKCEEKLSERQCIKTVTTLTNFELLEEQLGNDTNDEYAQYIVVNLTPTLFEKKYYERENYLIVFNRLLSFITLFSCYSVAEVVKNFIGTYIYSPKSLYNFRFIKRISYIFVFFAYIIHLSILIHGITHSVGKVYDTEVMEKVEFPLFRLCYEHMYEKKGETLATYVDWEEVNGPNLQMVDERSLSFGELVDKILVYDENQSYKELDLDKVDQSNQSDFRSFYIDDLKCFNFRIDKTYDARNPMVQKAEKLLEIHINLKNMNETEENKGRRKWRERREGRKEEVPEKRKRVWLFMNDEKTLNLDQNKPFDSNATVHYLTRSTTFEDGYWWWNNFEAYTRDLIVGPEPFGLFEYLDRLSQDFGKEQLATTTTVPLYCDETSEFRGNLSLRNRKFASFIHFRSIDAPYKNAYRLSDTVGMESYYMVRFTENRPEQKPEQLRLSFKPNLVRMTTRYVNNYMAIELFFHIVALTKIYFKFSFLEIPELAQRAWPVVQFFAFLVLYLMVLGLLYLFECWFRMAKFMELKYG